MKKNVLKFMFGIVCLEVLLVCILILVGDIDVMGWKAIGSGGTIFLCAVPCLFYAKVYDIEKYKNVALAGVVVSGITALFSVLNTWDIIKLDYFYGPKILTTLNVAMWVLAIICLLLSFISSNKTLNTCKSLEIILLIIHSASILFFIWFEFFPEGFLARLFFMESILILGLFIGILILKSIYKNETEKANTEQIQIQNQEQEQKQENC